MAATIGKVRAVFTASTSGLTSGVNQASASMKKLERDVSGLRGGMRLLNTFTGAQLFGQIAGGALNAARSVAQFSSQAFSGLSAAVQQATTLGEETSKSGVIFGEAAGQVAQFAANAARIGLAESAALQATGTFGNLFTAMGLGRQQAADYATTLTALGADLASFNNATVEESVLAIGAALRGEAEPIRRFGVLLDDATLRQEALNAGLVQSTKQALTPAIKAQAAYAAILKQTAAAQGDFERTSGSLANLGRIVSAQTINVVTDVGKAFEPVFQSAASAISRTLDAVRPFVQEVAEGVGSAIERIGLAIDNIVPAFTAFLGGLDGGAIGERIGEGILSGARFLAQVTDYVVQAIPAAWSYVQGVGQFWGSVFAVGQRVFDYLAYVGRLIESVFKFVGSIITGLVGRLLNAAGELTQLATFGNYGRDTERAGERLMATSKKLWDESGAAFEAAAENAANSLFGRVDEAGEGLAGPMTKAFDAALEQSKKAAATIQEAKNSAVEVKQVVTPQPQSPAQAAAIARPITEAVKGIDSRSSEGIREMFRIMRGDTGNDVQERIARAAERTADAVEDQEDADFEVLELAPAAGA